MVSNNIIWYDVVNLYSNKHTSIWVIEIWYLKLSAINWYVRILSRYSMFYFIVIIRYLIIWFDLICFDLIWLECGGAYWGQDLWNIPILERDRATPGPSQLYCTWQWQLLLWQHIWPSPTWRCFGFGFDSCGIKYTSMIWWNMLAWSDHIMPEPQTFDSMILRYYASMILWYYGTMLAWYYGTMLAWYYGIMLAWYYGIMLAWVESRMEWDWDWYELWRNGI